MHTDRLVNTAPTVDELTALCEPAFTSQQKVDSWFESDRVKAGIGPAIIKDYMKETFETTRKIEQEAARLMASLAIGDKQAVAESAKNFMDGEDTHKLLRLVQTKPKGFEDQIRGLVGSIVEHRMAGVRPDKDISEGKGPESAENRAVQFVVAVDKIVHNATKHIKDSLLQR